MPLLEEVGEGADESSPGGEAARLKADHRRRRASKARKKKRAEVRDVHRCPCFCGEEHATALNRCGIARKTTLLFRQASHWKAQNIMEAVD